MPSNTELQQRLQALKDSGAIGGFVTPHKNQGNGAPMLPWTIMPAREGASSTNYYNESDLLLAINVLEKFGPTVLRQPRA